MTFLYKCGYGVFQNLLHLLMRFSPKINHDIVLLEQLIRQGEGVSLDFKQTISDQKKIARTICAFANNKGGKLLVGVRDNGDVIGCEPEEEMYMLFEAAENFCDPPVDIYFTIFELEDDISVVEAEIKNSLKKPHFALDENDEWQIYMRSNDKTMMASSLSAKLIDRDEDAEAITDSKQQFVIDYLTTHESITAKQLTLKLNLSLQRANRILISLLQGGHILHHKDNRGDYYCLR